MGAASSVVDTVTSAVENVGSAINNAVQSALDDPVNTAIRVGATIVGGPAGLAAANTAIAVGQGEDVGTALEQGAKGYALGQIGSEVGAEVAGETGSTTAGQMASGATKSALSGGDPLTGAMFGGLNAATSEAAKAISDQNFEDWAKEQAAEAYDNAPSPTEEDVLAAMNETPTEAPLTAVADTTPPEAYDPAATTGEIKAGLDFAKNAILNPASVLNPLGSTDLSGLNPLSNANLAAFAAPQFLNTSAQYLGGQSSQPTTGSNEPAHLQELKQLYSSLTPEMASVMADRGITAPQTQDPSMTTTRFMADGGLAELNKIADSLSPTEKSLGFVKPYAANMLPAAPLMSNQMKLNPLRHLQESLVSRQRTAGGLAQGGLPQKYAEALPKGHKPEFITGLTGYYASGKGTGQSDDIDAMLHDGDYVADADLVAALGDGSSKAGAEALEKFRRQIPHQEHAVGGAAVPAKIADGEYVFPASFVTAIGGGDNKAGAKILDKMREAIRAHKRSAPTTKIPPKAKSPLDYLKMVKG